MVVLTLQLLNYAKGGIMDNNCFLKLALATKIKMSQTQTTNRAKRVHVVIYVSLHKTTFQKVL